MTLQMTILETGKPGNDMKLLEDFYNSLMMENFEEEEREPLEEWVGMLEGTKDPGLWVCVGTVKGEVVGGAVAEQYDDGRATLLTYLVVSETHRRRGFGSALVTSVIDEKGAPIFLEAHQPHISDRIMSPTSRLAFYKTLGFKPLALPYTAPAIEPGLPNIPGLMLLAYTNDHEGCDAADVKKIPQILLGGLLLINER
eukprot:TRINITY_DN5556_c0_g1_i1.p1 TRINITY_DN5556_c0_g1~~TRINITY_DN5556_c0_g1_i1.p1  ORF type:complete len:198 (+),score=24.06 TRINITY_DN5556_c0_g1_i1:41-634(+)